MSSICNRKGNHKNNDFLSFRLFTLFTFRAPLIFLVCWPLAEQDMVDYEMLSEQEKMIRKLQTLLESAKIQADMTKLEARVCCYGAFLLQVTEHVQYYYLILLND